MARLTNRPTAVIRDSNFWRRGRKRMNGLGEVGLRIWEDLDEGGMHKALRIFQED